MINDNDACEKRKNKENPALRVMYRWDPKKGNSEIHTEFFRKMHTNLTTCGNYDTPLSPLNRYAITPPEENAELTAEAVTVAARHGQTLGVELQFAPKRTQTYRIIWGFP